MSLSVCLFIIFVSISVSICQRSSFDSCALAFRLQLWPGYNTAIHLYDSGTLLNIDTSHKVMHMSTVLDALYELYESVGQQRFHNAATKMLVGETVLTRYYSSHLCSLSF